MTKPRILARVSRSRLSSSSRIGSRIGFTRATCRWMVRSATVRLGCYCERGSTAPDWSNLQDRGSTPKTALRLLAEADVFALIGNDPPLGRELADAERCFVALFCRSHAAPEMAGIVRSARAKLSLWHRKMIESGPFAERRLLDRKSR